jgi:lipoprotein-releasing system permease protein
MTVLEKGREIAILKAMGASRKSIMRIFMLEGVLIGSIGVILGLPLGLLICSLLVQFYKLPTDVYYISHLPVKVLPFDLILVSVSALLIGFLATLYPSWQAAKLDPAEALRYE